MKRLFLALGLVFMAISSQAVVRNARPIQSRGPRGIVEGEVIVRLAGAFNLRAAQGMLDNRKYRLKEVLSPTLNLYLVQVLNNKSSLEAVHELRRTEAVVYSQPNHFVSYRGFQSRGPRGVPNDPQAAQLWNMMDPSTGKTGGISATQVWNTSTGGKDKGGNDIVVAIIDGGFDINHPDLRQNIWVNRGEIPGNGKDDDGNGFIDDVNGWNVFNNNGTITSDEHGTHVAGTIGAVGNNGAGVVGVNWNVKIMPIQGSSGTTAVVAKAYGYVIEQKKLWYSSGGKKGANIVSTNSSFGVDNANCKSGDFPLWNDMYEAMGKLGILSAAATANNNVNVDQVGDVPTGCESEFIVSVTNTQQNDTKYNNAGYGLRTIDLGSPGTQILSTLPGNRYGAFTGTSMATPHVAGSIALLHSVASDAFYNMYITKPAEAALTLKASLLKGVDPLPALKGITVSGGRINVARSAQLMMSVQRRR